MRNVLVKLRFPGLIILALALAPSVQAVQMEYHTYNGFNAVEQALVNLELIFSDVRYHLLFAPILLGGALLSALRAVIKAMGNPNQGLSLMPGMIPLTLGVLVYLSLIAPKGTLILHDDVLNKNRIFTNIPTGIVITLGSVNEVERQFIDVIETTRNPAASYLIGAGGIGFDILQKVAGGTFLQVDDRLKQSSLKNYMSDCLLFEMTRTGTTLDVNAIHKTDDWIAILDQAVNPAVYTIMFTSANPEGAQMTCTDAWTGAGGLKSYFSSSTNLETIRKNVCASAGLDSTDAQQYQSCQQIFDEHLKIAAANNTSPMASMDYIRQAYMAQAVDQALSSSADQAAMAFANRNLMSQGMSTFLVANEFMPVIRSVLTSIAIGLIPILALMLPTSAFSKALSTMVGFFVFLTLWGVIDCWIHGLAMDMAVGYFQQVAMNHTGYAAIMLTPDAAGQSLAAFGVMRTASIGLASMAAGVFGFSSGAIMAQLTGQVMSPISQGAGQGASLSTTEGHGRARSELEGGWAAETVANVRPDFNARTQGEAGNRIEAQAGGKEKYDNLEATQDQTVENVRGGREAHAAEKAAAAKLGLTLPQYRAQMAGHRTEQEGKQLAEDQKLARKNGYTSAASMNVEQATHAKETALGQQAADDQMAALLNMDQQGFSQWKESGGVLSEKQAQHMRQDGYVWANAGMALGDMKLNPDGTLKTTRVQDQVNAENLEHYQMLAMGNALDNGRSFEDAKKLSDRIQEGMLVNATIGEHGHGDWDANRAFKVKDTQSASETTSFKDTRQDINQTLHQDTDETVIRKQVDADVWQASISGDNEVLEKVAESVWKDGKIDRGSVAGIMDRFADQAGKGYSLGKDSSEQWQWGDSAKLGIGTPQGSPIQAELGVSGGYQGDVRHSEHHDQLRGQLNGAAFNLVEQVESGKMDHATFNEKFSDLLESKAQQFHQTNIDESK